MNEWQPFKTAPKTGQVLIFHTGSDVVTGRWRWPWCFNCDHTEKEHEEMKNSGEWEYDCKGILINDPKYWMSPPALPENAK